MASGDAGLKVISREEVSKHSTAESAWMIMDGKIYDVTEFLSEHPGGEEVMLEVAGKDGTAAFADVGHSSDAKEMVKDYLIGKLPETEQEKKPAPASPSKSGASIADILTSPTWTNFIIPAAIGVVVYIVYKSTMRLVA